MAHIRLVEDHEATGLLKQIFDAAIARAGKVFGIVRLMSRNPPVLRASMAMYREIMFGDSPLSRSRRERLATVVSRTNDCFYWTLAHGEDLRAALVDEGVDPDRARAHMDAIVSDWRTATDLSPADTALCEYAEKATRTPAAMGAPDVATLRTHALDDTAVHDATQVIAWFNYINRIADCLGVDLEPEMLLRKDLGESERR